MEDKNIELNSKLSVVFPTSNEDHRLQLVGINGAIFAIVHSPLESDGPIRLFCEEWSLILLAPLKSKTNITVSAINVFCLSEIASEEGNVNIHASNILVKSVNLINPSEKLSEIGERGEFQFDNDLGSFLYHYQLFMGIVNNVRSKKPDSLLQAQQQFITGLCTLADKISGKSKDLAIQKVLDIWNIPRL